MPANIGRNRATLQPNKRFQYLVWDDFGVDLAAGALSNTLADGIGRRQLVTDGNNKMSISGGQLQIATGGVGAGNPGLWYEQITRVPGLAMVGTANYTTQGIPFIGWDGNQVTTPVDALSSSGTVLNVRRNSTGIAVGAVAPSTSYRLITIHRSTGMAYFISGGGYASPTLLYMSDVGSANSYPSVSVIGATTVAAVDSVRVLLSNWLPTPLVSDGFGGTWGVSDGLGHAEGMLGQPGRGGNGIAWTAQAGTWANSGGAANATALSGGLAIATTRLTTPNVLASIKSTRTAGEFGLILRYVDSSNYVKAIHNGTNVQLVKKVSGTDTTLINTAATYSVGAAISAFWDETAVRVYYNNVLIGTEQTINDGVFTDVTNFGKISTDTGNTFDDFNIYRRSGGEYMITKLF